MAGWKVGSSWRHGAGTCEQREMGGVWCALSQMQMDCQGSRYIGELVDRAVLLGVGTPQQLVVDKGHEGVFMQPYRGVFV